jgi:TetR/AcrR family transcriptional regulator of autoinduction and epiphytic fitness
MAERKEDVIAAATQVFLRYGYKRVTMRDLAEAAHLSRPALYLVFPSKDELFTAVLRRAFTAMLDEIRQGLSRLATPKEKLMFAFEIWCVRLFETIQASPDAKDLLESSYEFAAKVTTQANADFEALLAEVLQPLVRQSTGLKLSSAQVAHILTSAAPGFKASAKNSGQLRELIAGLIAIVLASLPARKTRGAR